MRIALCFLVGGTVANVLSGCQSAPKRMGEDRALAQPSGLKQITIIAKGIE